MDMSHTFRVTIIGREHFHFGPPGPAASDVAEEQFAAQRGIQVHERLCTAENSEQQALPDVGENVLVLSPEFYRQVTMHPIPTGLQAGPGTFRLPCQSEFPSTDRSD